MCERLAAGLWPQIYQPKRLQVLSLEAKLILGTLLTYKYCILIVYHKTKSKRQNHLFQGFEGDGLQCSAIISCYDDESLCDTKARCLYLDGIYKCKCNEEFFGNGSVCKGNFKIALTLQTITQQQEKYQFFKLISEAANQEEEFLLLTKGGSILRVPFSPSADEPGIPINIQGAQAAVGKLADQPKIILYCLYLNYKCYTTTSKGTRNRICIRILHITFLSDSKG